MARPTSPKHRWRRASAACTAVLAMLLAACATRDAASSPPPSTQGLDPVSSPAWEVDMARFDAGDAAHPPPADPVVFIGSSSFRMWTTLRRDFPDVPVLNRGFGGAQVRDLAWHADRIAIRYRPRVLLVYAGENDIDAGRTPGQVLADTRILVDRLRAALPDARIVWISIKPSPARAAQLQRQRDANRLVEAWLRTRPGTRYVEVATPMLDAQGAPRTDLFIGDRLHMNAAGYALWRDAIAPLLR